MVLYTKSFSCKCGFYLFWSGWIKTNLPNFTCLTLKVLAWKVMLSNSTLTGCRLGKKFFLTSFWCWGTGQNGNLAGFTNSLLNVSLMVPLLSAEEAEVSESLLWQHLRALPFLWWSSFPLIFDRKTSSSSYRGERVYSVKILRASAQLLVDKFYGRRERKLILLIFGSVWGT